METMAGASHQLHQAAAFPATAQVPCRNILCVGGDKWSWKAADLKSAGWEPIVVPDFDAAPGALDQSSPRVALVMLSADNAEAAEEFVCRHTEVEWIAVTRDSDMDCHAVRSVLANLFYDYHTLPIDIDRLLVMLGHAYGMATLRNVSPTNRAEGLPNGMDYHQMIGDSDEMRAIYSIIDKAAPSDFPILVRGESGTGKELVARAIHDSSNRAGGPLIIVNCGAVVPSLIQSELFGHEKGSFTNADARRDGYLAAAHEGTIFLDEVGELPLETQASLLRVLEENVFRRVGGSKNIGSDARVITATNRDLSQEVAQGKFRKDLFYRLSVVDIKLPSLAERRNDIEALANYYLNKLGPEVRSKAKGFSKSAFEAMLVYSWPGNVRELINRIKRAALLCENRLIQPGDLDLEPLSTDCFGGTDLADMTLKEAREEAERRTLVRTMERAQYNVTLTAKLLGISRVTLYNLIKKHELRK